MAISDVGEYAHLSSDQIEELGREFDAVRAEVIASRGERDYRYIHSSARAPNSRPRWSLMMLWM